MSGESTRGAKLHASGGTTLRTRVMLAISALLLVLAAVASVVAYNAVRTSYLGSEQSRLLRLLSVHGAAFQQTVLTMERGARFLAATPEVQAMVDARTAQARAKSRVALERLLYAYGKLHPEALQLRLIELAKGGREVVRLNREGRMLDVVPENRLQAKGDRPYVRAGADLPQRGVYISPITLNREFGQIQVPHVPVIRFVAPVFSDASGQRYGMIVINVDARAFLHSLRSGLPRATHVIVANESGDLLMSPDAQYDFGFELGHPYRLSGVLHGFDPALASAPLDGADLADNALQRVTADSLGPLYVVAGRLPFDASQSSRFLTLMLTRPAGVVDAGVWREFAPYGLTIVGLALILGLISALSTLRMFTPLQRLAEALREIGRGRYDAPLPEAASGEMLSFVSAVDVMRRDIRKREQDNRELAERLSASEAFSSGVIDAMPDSLLVIDVVGGRLVRANANAARMFGYSQDDFANLTLEDFVPDDVRPRHVDLRTSFMATLRKQRLATFPDLRARRADGETFPANVSIALMTQDDEEFFIIAVSDLSARKEMEDELRRNEERFRLMTENIRDYSIIMLDPEGRIVTWNAGAERLHGYPAEEMLGEYFGKLYSSDEIAAEVPTKLLQRARTEGIARLEGWRSRKGGRRFFAQVMITPTYDASGRLLGFVKIDHDQSERLSAEMAKAASESKSQFLANMSHEIRTPLNGVVGLTQLLLDTPLDKRQSDYMHKLNDAARSLLKILNDILDYSKIEAGRLELERAPFNLDDTLDTVTTLYSFRAEEKGIELLLDIEPGLPQGLLGDKLRLSQVLNNLVGNAVKFTERGEVRINVSGQRLDERRVRLDCSVQDTGIGMSSEQVKELFQAFHQADSSITRRFGGTGLGLVISQRLIEAMGGDIRVTSTLGQGSTFSFEVVLDYDASIGEGRSREPGQLTPMRVLVVDDNPAMVDILEGMLRVWGMEVYKATDAYAGLGIAREVVASGESIGLYLIDWKMPHMDGLSMAEQLQWMSERGEVNEAPLVVMVTAYGHEQVKQAADKVTLQGVLDKPVTASRLFDLLISVQHGQDARGSELSEPRSAQLRGRTQSIRGAQVLLVEDNPTNQLVARSFLEKLELVVDIAGNGQEAVEMAQAQNYDAILMDLQMPVMDGFEATRRIRALPEGARVPIIAMTAAALVSDREASEAAGMNAHVAKPIELDKLVETLLAWIRPREAGGDGSSGAVSHAAFEPTVPSLPGLDLERAAGQLGGDQRLLRSVLESFRRDFSDAPVRVQELIELGQLPDAARMVHTIKGLAPNLGAPALAVAAAEYEAALRQGDAQAELHGRFIQTLTEVLAALDGLESEPTREPVASFTAATPEDLETLRALAANLDQSVIISQLQKDRVASVLHGRIDAVQVDKLFTAISHLDYSEAARVLDGILRELRGAKTA